MGTMRNTQIEQFAERTGIQPATGDRQVVLTEMSECAYALIKVIELESSGIRDGDGHWSGSDPLAGTMNELIAFWKELPF